MVEQLALFTPLGVYVEKEIGGTWRYFGSCGSFVQSTPAITSPIRVFGVCSNINSTPALADCEHVRPPSNPRDMYCLIVYIARLRISHSCVAGASPFGKALLPLWLSAS